MYRKPYTTTLQIQKYEVMNNPKILTKKVLDNGCSDVRQKVGWCDMVVKKADTVTLSLQSPSIPRTDDQTKKFT